MGRQFVLIGAGQTSVSAARALRRLDFDGEITIIGDELFIPYQKPALSKEYLQGRSTLEEIWSAPKDWYKSNNVKLLLGKQVSRIDLKSLDVILSDGTAIKADSVLIATGGTPRLLAGAETDAVCYLRNLDDADRIKREIKPGAHVIVIGGGFIGSEVAASAKAMGANVTILEALKTPLHNALGPDIGAICEAIHLENGVTVKCGVQVESVTVTDLGKEVRTKGGDTLIGDVVVAGVGITPNDQIARASEITVGNGIRVDEFCRTSADHVFAAGDVANHTHPLYGRRIRIEHFDNATRQGTVAARNMLGIRTEHNAIPWFWSDQYDHNLQYAGHADKWDEIVIRGSVKNRDFVAFYLNKGMVDAVFGVNRGGEVMLAKTLIADRAVVDKAILQNENIDFEDIVLKAEEEDAAAQVAAGDQDAAETHGDFQLAARSGQVREGGVRRFVVGDIELAIARSKGKVYALHNLCTHLACHLASGAVEAEGLTCLCHGSVFELATGIPINPPATRPVKTYPTREQDGHIYVNLK